MLAETKGSSSRANRTGRINYAHTFWPIPLKHKDFGSATSALDHCLRCRMALWRSYAKKKRHGAVFL